MTFKLPNLASSLKAVGLIILLVITAFAGGVLSRFFDGEAGGIEYTDYLSIMLTAISVLLTALAIFLAVLAFVGWRSISDRVQQSVEAYLRSGFEVGGDLYLKMREQAQAMPYDGVSDFAQDTREDSNPAEGNDDEQ